MIILTLRTDKPEAELGLFDDHNQLSYIKWHAHRELSTTIHSKITELLTDQELNWSDLEGIVVFSGPGSFTGLRIGISVANAVSYSQSIPIVGMTNEVTNETTDGSWLASGIDRLTADQDDKNVLPVYGRDAHITTQRK